MLSKRASDHRDGLEKGKRLPFDVSGFRTLFHENSIAGKASVGQGLRRHVEAITRERPAALAV